MQPNPLTKTTKPVSNVNVINGEVIAHIPREIIEQIQTLQDGQQLHIEVINGAIILRP